MLVVNNIFSLLLLGVALVLFVAPRSIAGPIVIDQSSIPPGFIGGSGPEPNAGSSLAQTVTVGISGLLQTVELRATERHQPSEDLLVELQSLIGM